MLSSPLAVENDVYINPQTFAGFLTKAAGGMIKPAGSINQPAGGMIKPAGSINQPAACKIQPATL